MERVMHSDWATPIVPKKDGNFRISGDYSQPGTGSGPVPTSKYLPH